MSIVRLGSAGVLLGAAALLAGCHHKPAGQVVATVDGSEITRRDLVAEMSAAGGRTDADLKALQPTLVTSIVDRKLLVAEAKRQKLDKSPDFLSAEQRQRDILLASMFAQSLNLHASPPSAADLSAFIAANPSMFANRKLLLANEISAPAAGITPATVAPLHGPDQIRAYLAAHKIKFAQRTATIDTLTLPPDLATKLLSLPAGETIAIRNGAAIVFTTILNSRETPIPADQQTKVATALMQRQAATKQLDEEVKQLRGSADIQYLPGFEVKAPAN